MKRYHRKIKHIVEYIGFVLLIRILRIFGIDKSAAICSYLARVIGPFLPITKIAKRNLYDVFGDQLNHDIIIQQLWDNFGRYIGEFPYINILSDKEIDQRIEIIGAEYLEELKKQNQPFLLFAGHFANWDIITRILPKFYHEFGVVYRKANNPYVNDIINNSRLVKHIHLITKGPQGGRQLVKAIKSRYAIAMLVDQKMNDGIEVPFFNKPAMTSYAIAKFAVQLNYPIIPCQIIRTEGSYFRVIIHKPVECEKIDDTNLQYYNIMHKINIIMEGWIAQTPGSGFGFITDGKSRSYEYFQ